MAGHTQFVNDSRRYMELLANQVEATAPNDFIVYQDRSLDCLANNTNTYNVYIYIYIYFRLILRCNAIVGKASLPD